MKNNQNIGSSGIFSKIFKIRDIFSIFCLSLIIILISAPTVSQSQPDGVATAITSPIDAESINTIDEEEINMGWDSVNSEYEGAYLEETTFEFYGPDGGYYTETFSIDRDVSKDKVSSKTRTFDLTDELSSISQGEWFLNVSDSWRDIQGDTFDTVNFTVEENVYGDVQTEISSPNSGSEHSLDEDLMVEWSSTNDYNVDRRLVHSNIVISGDGESYQEDIDRSVNISEGKTAVQSTELDLSQFSLDEGLYSLAIQDNWEDEESSDTLDLEISSSGAVSLNINSPSGAEVHNSSESLQISWDSINDYNIQKNLVESEIRLEGSNGRSYTETVEIGEIVSSGGSISNENVIDGDVFEGFNEGSWEVEIIDYWEMDESSSSVTFTAEDQSNDQDTESSANYSIGVSSPSSGSSFDYGSGEVSVEWTSSNDGDSSRELTESSVIFEGGAGLTEIDSIDRGESVSSDNSVSRSVTYGSSTWESLEPGDFTLTVRDDWEDSETVEESVDVSIDSETDGSQDPDNSTDDSTDEDTNSSDSGSDSTDDSSDGDSSNDRVEEGSDGEDNDCPEGFSWDDGVCVEDSSSDSDGGDFDGSTDENDDSTDNSDSPNDDSSDDESSTDDQNSDEVTDGNDDSNTSMLQQEVAAGISVQTVLIGLLAVLTLGLLFRRSSYTLKF